MRAAGRLVMLELSLYVFVTYSYVVAHPLPNFVADFCLGLLQLLRLYTVPGHKLA